MSEIRVGMGSCGRASGADAVHEALLTAARGVPVRAVGCNGLCHREPLVEVVDEDGHRTLYSEVSPALVPRIVERHLRRFPWREWIGEGREQLESSRLEPEREPFLARQHRIVLENSGEIDPLSLDAYRERDGYLALGRCLEIDPDEIIDIVQASGLRGRGGAGFPTARKWALARTHPGPRTVIANGDEGDPGAFMDRLVLESDPHRVVEGLAIAALAVGAEQGIFYIRAEYPLAVRHIREAIRQAEEAGLIGAGALGDGRDLHLVVREGAGAFVCGEETALIASLEGRRGMPRLRPPYPVESGLQGRPTVVNNVETLACLPWIVRHGAEAFAALGTETSKGTKVFALAGRIRRGGLVEVPMGTTIREVVEELGGGVEEGHSFKAVQLGGPSGGCLPAELADTPIDYEALRETGAIMGSGGLVVLDDRDCLVDMARYFLRFTQAESCGKCTFCRIGTKRMLEILDRLCEGRGRPEDIPELEELADRVGRTSLCGLGQTAPNPVLTALRYFRDEFEAHVNERRCPSARCPELIEYSINPRCSGCTLCAQVCPVAAIECLPYELHSIDQQLCTKCGMCFEVCQDEAVEVA